MQTGNPYIAGSPLRDPEGFFGRQDIIDWVSAELSNIHTNALVLYGQRRVGKTTILLQLRHSLSSDKFLPIYFDLQDQAKLRLGEVLANLADSIGGRINLSEHKPESFDDEGKYFRSVFLPDLYRVLDKESRPVFLLDEFDVLDQGDEGSLENNVASRALFPLLRQVIDDDIRPAFVFVVGRRTEDLRVDFNQMFKTSLTKEVWVLDRLSAETLVRQAEVNGTLKFTQQSIDRILQLTKSHAYLTQLVCQRLWQRAYAGKPSGTHTINVDDVTASIPDALEVGDQALIWLWNGLGPAEKIYAAVLAEISDEGKSISEDQVIKVLAEHAARARLRRREVELAPQDLITRHVLELADSREYIFAIELFRRWVKQKRSLKDVVDEIDKVDPIAQQLFELGQAYYKKREWSDAVRFFNDALRQNPSHFRANLLLGETFLAMGQTEDSIRQLEIAYSLDSYESQYPLARALIVFAKEKEKNSLDQDALSFVERALAISPNERLAQDIKNNILEREGDLAFLREDFATALVAFEKSGNMDKAEQVRREFKIKELKTLELKAQSCVQKKDWKKAIPLYEELIDKAPDQKHKDTWSVELGICKEEEKLESLFTLGLGSLTSGNWNQAKKSLSELVYLRPEYTKDNKSAVKLLEQAIAARRTIVAENFFQSNLFRVFGSLSLLIVIVYFVLIAFRNITEVSIMETPTSPTIFEEPLPTNVTLQPTVTVLSILNHLNSENRGQLNAELSGLATNITSNETSGVLLDINSSDGNIYSSNGAYDSVNLYGRFETTGEIVKCIDTGNICLQFYGKIYFGGGDGSGFADGTVADYEMYFIIGNDGITGTYVVGKIPNSSNWKNREQDGSFNLSLVSINIGDNLTPTPAPFVSVFTPVPTFAVTTALSPVSTDTIPSATPTLSSISLNVESYGGYQYHFFIINPPICDINGCQIRWKVWKGAWIEDKQQLGVDINSFDFSSGPDYDSGWKTVSSSSMTFDVDAFCETCAQVKPHMVRVDICTNETKNNCQTASGIVP